MRFIALIISLGLLHFTPIKAMLPRFDWFTPYTQQLRRYYAPLNPNLGLLALILPPFLVGWALYAAFYGWLLYLIALVMQVTLLLYCLDWKAHPSETDWPKTSSDVLREAYQNLFAPCIVFILTGVIGLWLWLLLQLIQTSTQNPQNNTMDLTAKVRQILSYVDWLCLRVMVLLYSLAGDFIHTFGFLVSHILARIEHNEEFMITAGKIALGTMRENVLLPEREQQKEAMKLIFRALVIGVAMVGLFTLGSFY